VSGLLEAALLGVVAFAATNVDDLFVLTAFFADPSSRAWHVVLGQYLGIAVLTVASMACALAALAIPTAWVGLLGLLPVAIGVKKLYEARRRIEAPAPPLRAAGTAALSVAAVTVANGGDNLVIYISLFASQSRSSWLLLAGVFAVLTGLWCVVGLSLVRHRTLGPLLRRHGRRVLPWLLIGLGVYIIVRSGVWTLWA
jgi:cadmium resistance protein CadD (predicted permease)